MYRSPPISYADRDEYLGADLGEIDEAFNENIDPLVDHYHHYVDSYDWKNSRPARPFRVPALFARAQSFVLREHDRLVP